MKKNLLLAAFLMGSYLTVSAQTYQAEYFSNLTVGNLSTDITGETPGQDNWNVFATNGATETLTTTTTNMDASSIQVVDAGGEYGNALQLTGPNGDRGAAYAWKNGLTDFWTNRTAGNDIIEVEFSYFTGPATTSLNNMRAVIFSADGSKVLSGINIARNTGYISGLGYYSGSGGVGGYIFSLGTEEQPNVVLPENTWVRVGFSYNSVTGEITFKVGEDVAGSVIGAAPGDSPSEVDIYVISGSTQTVSNAASSIAWFDNVRVEANATDTLLGVNDVVAVTSEFSIYPNPANDVINIANADALVNNVAISDINGRTVKSVKFDGVADAQVNVSDLASGVYMMTVSSDKGTTTKKIVKN